MTAYDTLADFSDEIRSGLQSKYLPAPSDSDIPSSLLAPVAMDIQLVKQSKVSNPFQMDLQGP